MKSEYISKFKKLLTERAVSFQYYKKDGTLRTANGTMKADLLPKTEPGKKFKIEDIESSNGVKTAKHMTVFITESELKAVEHESEAVSAAIDKCLGTRFEGSYIYYEVEPKEKRDMPEDSIFYYDLDKKAFRSFKADKLFNVALAEGDNW